VTPDLRFPIGDFDLEDSLQNSVRETRIESIVKLPEMLLQSLDGLDEEQLNTPYRPDGWTVRQLVHHVADSHLNAYCRFKLALTELNPTIRAYYEDKWAEMPDSELDLEPSIKIIEGVHLRWAAILQSMTNDDFERNLNHPESGAWTLEGMTALYDWHSRHHTAHITALRDRLNW
jgi:hypothetical protein